jgi:hypothetical protein
MLADALFNGGRCLDKKNAQDRRKKHHVEELYCCCGHYMYAFLVTSAVGSTLHIDTLELALLTGGTIAVKEALKHVATEALKVLRRRRRDNRFETTGKTPKEREGYVSSQVSHLDVLCQNPLSGVGDDVGKFTQSALYFELDAAGVLLEGEKLWWNHYPDYGPNDQRKPGQPDFFGWLRRYFPEHPWAQAVLAGHCPRNISSSGGLFWPTVSQWKSLEADFNVPNTFVRMLPGTAYFVRRGCYHMVINCGFTVSIVCDTIQAWNSHPMAK